MIHPKDTLLYRLWFLVVVMLVATNLVLLALRLSGADAISAGSTASLARVANDTNTISGRIFKDANRSLKYVGSTLGNSAAVAGQGVAGAVISVLHIPGQILGSISDKTVVSDLIRPVDKTPVPVINPLPAAVPAAQTVSQATPLAQPAQSVATSAASPAQWPIHGVITTQFGVPELPYERIHTGLDISDGKPAGTTPIRPFRPGRVIGVIHSGSGLGNHVIVDHGGGLTSVYGHMYSISVQEGQQVNDNTVLGYEGFTGVATGTHLHFEIRVNGQAVNPQRYIAGQP